LIALSGSLSCFFNDGYNKIHYTLNKPNIGLHIPPGIWRVRKLSSGAICLVLASDVFMEEEDYIRDFDEFMDSKDEATLLGSI
jgi:hypothetical protein